MVSKSCAQQHEELLEECGIEEKHREEAKLILLIALHYVQFVPDDRPSMNRVLRLLQGSELVGMPPNPFLYLGSSTRTRIESSSLTRSDSNNIVPTEPILIGPWGGLEGKNWDDGVNNGVKQILVFITPKRISGIKIEYCGKYRDSYWSRSHGTADSSTIDIDMNASEMGDRIQQFTSLQLQTSTLNLDVEIGHGAYGDVYRGTLGNGKVVAIKVLKSKTGSHSETLEKQFNAEVITLGKTHHRNVVELCGFCSKDNMKAIVYEFMENGSLKQLLCRNQSIEWETLCTIAKGTAKGLSYLHEDCEPGIIHYDIKPSNILLDSKFIPKVGDFGLAKLLPRDATHITLSGFRGTCGYIAPEFNTPFPQITHKCDVFSYGMTLFDIISWNYFKDDTSWFPGQVWKKFKEGNQEDFMEQCGIHMKNREQAKRMFFIALRCVQFLPADRPSMSDVVRLLDDGKELELPNNPGYEGRPLEGKEELKLPEKPKRIICEENCLIIGAKELQIGQGDNPEHWRWTTNVNSRFSEVAQLVSMNVIDIRSKINAESLQRLRREMTYVVYLVFKFAENARGLDLKTEVKVSFTDGKQGATGTHSVYLDPSGQRRPRVQYPLHSLGRIHRLCGRLFREMSASISQSVYKSRFPCQRDDGWMEIQMGKFNNDDEDRMLDVSLVITRKLEKVKSGLIVARIQRRPKIAAWWHACAKA